MNTLLCAFAANQIRRQVEIRLTHHCVAQSRNLPVSGCATGIRSLRRRRAPASDAVRTAPILFECRENVRFMPAP